MSKAKDVIEVKGILKDLKNKRCRLPNDKKDMLEWSVPELNAYIIKTTKGMGIAKRFKFARELDAEIREKKRLKKNL